MLITLLNQDELELIWELLDSEDLVAMAQATRGTLVYPSLINTPLTFYLEQFISTVVMEAIDTFSKVVLLSNVECPGQSMLRFPNVEVRHVAGYHVLNYHHHRISQFSSTLASVFIRPEQLPLSSQVFPCLQEVKIMLDTGRVPIEIVVPPSVKSLTTGCSNIQLVCILPNLVKWGFTFADKVEGLNQGTVPKLREVSWVDGNRKTLIGMLNHVPSIEVVSSNWWLTDLPDSIHSVNFNQCAETEYSQHSNCPPLKSASLNTKEMSGIPLPQCLRQLSVGEHVEVEFPDNLFSLCCQSPSTRIFSSPMAIKDLQIFRLETELPCLVSWVHLRHLEIAYSSRTHITINAPNLDKLGVYNNRNLESIDVVNPKRIHTLDISGNNLVKLPSLVRFALLVSLNVSSNPVGSVEIDAPHLRKLFINRVKAKVVSCPDSVDWIDGDWTHFDEVNIGKRNGGINLPKYVQKVPSITIPVSYHWHTRAITVSLSEKYHPSLLDFPPKLEILMLEVSTPLPEYFGGIDLRRITVVSRNVPLQTLRVPPGVQFVEIDTDGDVLLFSHPGVTSVVLQCQEWEIANGSIDATISINGECYEQN